MRIYHFEPVGKLIKLVCRKYMGLLEFIAKEPLIKKGKNYES